MTYRIIIALTGLCLFFSSNVFAFEPTIVGSVTQNGRYSGIAVADGCAYMVDNNGYVAMFDITDPSHPYLLGKTKLEIRSLFRITINNGYVFITSYEKELYVFKICDIKNHSDNQIVEPIASLELKGAGVRGVEIAIVGKYIYYATQGGSNHWRSGVVNIEDPERPFLVTEYGPGGLGLVAGMAIASGSSAHGITNNHLRLVICHNGEYKYNEIDITQPEKIRLLETNEPCEKITRMAISEHYMCLALSYDNLRVFNTPGQPCRYCRVNSILDVVIYGDYAYTVSDNFFGDALTNFHIIKIGDACEAAKESAKLKQKQLKITNINLTIKTIESDSPLYANIQNYNYDKDAHLYANHKTVEIKDLVFINSSYELSNISIAPIGKVVGEPTRVEINCADFTSATQIYFHGKDVYGNNRVIKTTGLESNNKEGISCFVDLTDFIGPVSIEVKSIKISGEPTNATVNVLVTKLNNVLKVTKKPSPNQAEEDSM